MAYVHVKYGGTEQSTIECPDTSFEVAEQVYPQFDSNSDFIIIQNHVFSKMAIDHLYIEAHEDEAENSNIPEEETKNENEKETAYMA